MEQKRENEAEMEEKREIDSMKEAGPLELPAVTLRGMTILPDMIIHFDLSREKSVLAVEAAMMGSQRLFAVTQKDPEDQDPV